MKRMTVGVVAVTLAIHSFADDGVPFAQAYYRNENWTVLKTGAAGEYERCRLQSAPRYLDKYRNPDYGTVVLSVGYPDNQVTFSGKNSGSYFRTSRRIEFHVDNGSSVEIVPETPVRAKGIVDKMFWGKKVKIEIEIAEGEAAMHIFPLSGFRDAYKKLRSCAK